MWSRGRVVVSTADHCHAVATAAALRLGKHVYCEKPLTHTLYETRTIARLAAKNRKLATQMGTQIHATENYRRVVELVKSTLENYGYRVLTAFNGLKAIACFEAHKQEIRLLITDTDMPYLNGIKAMRAVQKIEPNLPIILASGTELDTEQFNAKSEIVRLRKPIRCGPAPEYHCQGVGDLGRGLRFGISSTG